MGARYGIYIQKIKNEWCIWGKNIYNTISHNTLKEALDTAKIYMDITEQGIQEAKYGWTRKALEQSQEYIKTTTHPTQEGYEQWRFGKTLEIAQNIMNDPCWGGFF
jgi:hypothetical protein